MLLDARLGGSEREAMSETITIPKATFEALVAACKATIDDYDKATQEKYDELSWDAFAGVDRLRAALALAKDGGS